MSAAEAGGASSASGSGAGGASAGSSAVSGSDAAASAGWSTGGDNSAGWSTGGGSAGTSGSGPCGFLCPSPFLELQLAVLSSAGIGEVSGVEATLLGPVTVQLECTGFAGTTRCLPTEGAPEGIYLLEATAPGFQTAVVSVTVTFTPAEGCGCATASAYPSLITLNPTRL